MTFENSPKRSESPEGAHPQFLIERQKALVDAAHQITHIIAVQREIVQRLKPFAVDLDLPTESVWTDALAKCSQLYKE